MIRPGQQYLVPSTHRVWEVLSILPDKKQWCKLIEIRPGGSNSYDLGYEGKQDINDEWWELINDKSARFLDLYDKLNGD